MRIVGIDPGTINAGWGVIEKQGNRLVGVDAGVMKLGAKKPLAVRLQKLEAALQELLSDTKPDAMALEEVFFAKHPNAALKLGHARGVVMLVAAQRSLSIHEYPPALVKQTVTGRGAADKVQVSRLVAAMLGWHERLEHASHDTTDALAIAITHAQASRFLALRSQPKAVPLA